jgi:uncharacterized protein YbaR (Trm112 family)
MRGNRWDRFRSNQSKGGMNEEGTKQFEQLEASVLYCPRCKRAVPVRKRLLLVLPTQGDKYEYLCAQCSTSVGTKMEETKQKIKLIHT